MFTWAAIGIHLASPQTHVTHKLYGFSLLSQDKKGPNSRTKITLHSISHMACVCVHGSLVQNRYTFYSDMFAPHPSTTMSKTMTAWVGTAMRRVDRVNEAQIFVRSMRSIHAHTLVDITTASDICSVAPTSGEVEVRTVLRCEVEATHVIWISFCVRSSTLTLSVLIVLFGRRWQMMNIPSTEMIWDWGCRGCKNSFLYS